MARSVILWSAIRALRAYVGADHPQPAPPFEAVAKRHSWEVVAVFEDARDQRPGFAAMMKSVARREFDMVAAWSVDRLGRSLTNLLEFLKGLHAERVDLFLHQQGLDTSTPSGRPVFRMMGVFAEFEPVMTRERVLM